MSDQRIGMGYDVHCFAAGRKLVLGGVEIPHDKGLDGHSDADVLLHAVCDAVLGALGKGDIGEHFPNTDDRYRNISSMALLETVRDIVQQEGYDVSNVDAMLVAEEPHVKAYKGAMCMNIAHALSIEPNRVNIKATTNEGMGFVGRKEGIAAYASVLLYQKEQA